MTAIKLKQGRNSTEFVVLATLPYNEGSCVAVAS